MPCMWLVTNFYFYDFYFFLFLWFYLWDQQYKIMIPYKRENMWAAEKMDITKELGDWGDGPIMKKLKKFYSYHFWYQMCRFSSLLLSLPQLSILSIQFNFNQS